MKFKFYDSIQINDLNSVNKVINKMDNKYKNIKDKHGITPLALAFYNLLYYNDNDSKEIFKLIISDKGININMYILVMDKYKKIKYNNFSAHILVYILYIVYKEHRHDILSYVQNIISREDLDYSIFYEFYNSPVLILKEIIENNIEINMSYKLIEQIFKLKNYIISLDVYKWIKINYSKEYVDNLLYIKILNNKLSKDIKDIDENEINNIMAGHIFFHIVFLSDNFYKLIDT